MKHSFFFPVGKKEKGKKRNFQQFGPSGKIKKYFFLNFLLEDNFLVESKKIKLDDAPVVNLAKPQRDITFTITDPTKISSLNAFKVFVSLFFL